MNNSHNFMHKINNNNNNFKNNNNFEEFLSL